MTLPHPGPEDTRHHRDAAIIRPATSEDVPAILAIEQQAASAAHWSANEYERILAGEVLLVAEISGTLVGFICAKQAASDWELENIVVAHAFQRRGIAGELLLALLARVRKSSGSIVCLEVRESNLAARRFYEKHGFLEVGSRRRYYQQPDEDAVLYKFKL